MTPRYIRRSPTRAWHTIAAVPTGGDGSREN
jgi:hypothetical protein